jgi:hypothetical protein
VTRLVCFSLPPNSDFVDSSASSEADVDEMIDKLEQFGERVRTCTRVFISTSYFVYFAKNYISGVLCMVEFYVKQSMYISAFVACAVLRVRRRISTTRRQRAAGTVCQRTAHRARRQPQSRDARADIAGSRLRC